MVQTKTYIFLQNQKTIKYRSVYIVYEDGSQLPFFLSLWFMMQYKIWEWHTGEHTSAKAQLSPFFNQA